MGKKKNKFTDLGTPRELDYHEEFDMILPFCPNCGELAYELDKCVFCGQVFAPTKEPVDPNHIVVKTEHWEIEQTGCGLWITHNGVLQSHASLSHPLSEKELQEMVNKYEEVGENGNKTD